MATRGTGESDHLAYRQTDRVGRRAIGYERDGLGTLLVRLQRQALAHLHLVADDRFLDVGCATGAAARAAATQVATAVGVDLSSPMLRHARVHPGAPAGAHYVLGRAEQLPFAAGTFTAVLCSTVLHYLDEPVRAVAEMTRVLDAGGRLVIGDLEDRHRAAGSVRGVSRGWPDLAVIHRQRTLTPFGFYVVILMARTDR